MNKILLAIFDNETAAFDGLRALSDLHRDGDITLYAWAVIVKDRTGKISFRHAPEEGGAPLGAALGLLTDKLVTALKGPAGLAIGASLPGLTGYAFDLELSSIGPSLLSDVAKALTAGKAAVLAEVEESSPTRIDQRLKKHGAQIFRRLPAELIEEQLVRESIAFEVKLKGLDAKLKRAVAENRAAIQKEIEHVKTQRKAMQDQAKARVEQANAELGAKLKTLEAQAREGREQAKRRVERRVAALKADFERRTKKLSQAFALAER